jgi:N-acetyltransferase 10
MKYGTRALQALNSFYSGELTNLDEVMEDAGDAFAKGSKVSKDASLQSDNIGIRDPRKMPPLLQRLSERKPEPLDYLGVSFGLSQHLLQFWRKAGFVPLYASQKENALTGEFTFVMLRELQSKVAEADNWLAAFAQG